MVEMIVDRGAGFITIEFEEPQDWRELPWRKIIDEIKILGGKYGGEDDKRWYIPDTPYNVEEVNRITEEYTRDKNQLGLFE